MQLQARFPLALLGACFWIASTALHAQSFAQNKVIAHRGAWKNTQAPQNSLASLKHAIRLGCAGAEFDIRMTKDEVLVINHDLEYQGLDIEKSSYQELLGKPLKNGEPLPTLQAYLKAGKKQRHTRLIAEIKPSPSGKERSLHIAAKVVALVQKVKAQRWVTYISFDYDVLKKVHELDSKAPTQYLNGSASIAQLTADGLGGADYHFSVFQRDDNWIKQARQAGLTTNAWTVNDSLVMDFLLVRGIDYLTTDEPELALRKTALFAAKQPTWTLVWSDEFQYKGLPDSTKWGYDVGGHGWGNNEAQYYTRADTNNAVVREGRLFITARAQTLQGKSYTSARLISKNKGDWTYGKIEVRARLPKGRGTWPAVWMLPTDWKYGNWPASGEIDIMEHVGYMPDSIFGSIHTQSFNHMLGTQATKGMYLANAYTHFHRYAVEWQADNIVFYFDGQPYLTFRNRHTGSAEWPFDQRFHLLLNLAVGGNWGGKMGIAADVFPATMEVDYVRVFQKMP